MKNTNKTMYSAFNSTNLPDLPPASTEHQNRLYSALNIPLFWGNYTNLDSATELELDFEMERDLTEEEKESTRHINTLRWNFEINNRWSHLIFITKIMSSFSVPIFISLEFTSNLDEIIFSSFLVIFSAFASLVLVMTQKPQYYIIFLSFAFLSNAGILAWQQQTLWGFWQGYPFFITGCILFFLAVIGCDLLLFLHAYFYQHDGSQFNRRTGMVHLAGKRWRKPFVAPFYEFDPVMQVQVMPHGQRDYVLWLYHRYTDKKVCLANRIHSLGLDQNNLRAFWDTLQRYMDVSQPLPDLPVLEPCRQQDPITATYDKAQDRPPRYWRDMSERHFKQEVLPRLREQLRNASWPSGPGLIAAHTDPA
ncbi:hypothetical protein Q9290_05250, partial [Oceanimonas sp. CHS3-5]|uniref:hypothetical protein n=1 Tax=Oceanimonas sp. CHS3-5 TaxID=3068186 RepID=UPI00273F5222